MRFLANAALCAAVAAIAPLTIAERAAAEITISINKANQTMSVLVDGVERHHWLVSTGAGGGPRAGTYKPQRLEKKWFSHKYGMSPMPSSIFFHEGFAIHGTMYVSRLGHAASHGCVRLLPANAATLFDMVRGQGKDTTTIVISNTAHVAARTPPAPKIDAPALAPKIQARMPQDVPARETTAKAMPAETPAPVAATVEPVAAPVAETPAVKETKE